MSPLPGSESVNGRPERVTGRSQPINRLTTEMEKVESIILFQVASQVARWIVRRIDGMHVLGWSRQLLS